MVPVSLNENFLTEMLHGKTLKLTTTVNGHGVVSFELPLQGFGNGFAQMIKQNRLSAYDRKLEKEKKPG